MKTYRTAIRPAVQVEVVDKVTCDLCGRVIPKPESCVYEDTSVRLVEHHDYPESQQGRIYEYDICPHCFKSRLMVWLHRNGAEPTIKEYSEK